MPNPTVFTDDFERDLYDGNDKNREENEARHEAELSFLRLIAISRSEGIPLSDVLRFLSAQQPS